MHTYDSDSPIFGKVINHIIKHLFFKNSAILSPFVGTTKDKCEVVTIYFANASNEPNHMLRLESAKLGANAAACNPSK
ncbi:hypothetical protein SAMN05443572_11112 [Myxococcus fulvus]|uniref:Uncharacterized protein n=1 Tax=Myxococcus fulvus TaxID=33 RepID=A0ABY1CT82_MYXFU|nr:hypothetical protein SAMN05443572_11112 [Myxococcus fulvus]